MWQRVLAPTLLVSGIWIAVSSVTTIFLDWATRLQRGFLEENVATIRTVAELENLLLQMHSLTLNHGKNEFSDAAGELGSLTAKCDQLLNAAQAAASHPEKENLILELHWHVWRYSGLLRQQLAQAPQPEGGSASVLEALTALTISSRQLLQFDQQLLAEAVASRTKMYQLLTRLRTPTVVVGPVLGVLCGLWIARRVRQSIARISVTLSGTDMGDDREVGQVMLTPATDLPGLEEQVRSVGDRIHGIVGELHQARQQLARSERLAVAGQLAAGVAHELRNPLTSLKLLIQTAARRGPGASLDEKQSRVVQEEIARMEDTIQGLLDFARPPVPKRVRHDLGDTIRRALNLIEARAKQRKVVLQLKAPQQPLLLDGDPEQIHQVLINLLLNGIDAAGSGGQVGIEVSSQSAPHKAYRVTVTDTGRGIPETILDRLFEPFATGKEWGTGLGLAISRRIVEEHGGTITAFNRAAGGAEFTIQLPADADPCPSPTCSDHGRDEHAQTAGHR